MDLFYRLAFFASFIIAICMDKSAAASLFLLFQCYFPVREIWRVLVRTETECTETSTDNNAGSRVRAWKVSIAVCPSFIYTKVHYPVPCCFSGELRVLQQKASKMIVGIMGSSSPREPLLGLVEEVWGAEWSCIKLCFAFCSWSKCGPV